MSVEASARIWRSGLKGDEKLVLLAIADHADPHGRNAWPKIDTLAAYSSLSRRTVQRLLPKLAERGYISIKRNTGGTITDRGNRRPNLYVIHFAALPAGVDLGVTEEATGPDLGVTKADSRGDKTRSRGDSPVLKSGQERPSERPFEPPLPPGQHHHANRPTSEKLDGRTPKGMDGHPRHEAHENAKKVCIRLHDELRLPIESAEMLAWCYRLGDGDPWAGQWILKGKTDNLTTANSPAGALRKRLRDAEPRARDNAPDYLEAAR